MFQSALFFATKRKWESLDDEKFMLNNISENASYSPSEAMAELFVMKLTGKKIQEEAVSIISKYSKEFAKCLDI